MKITMKFIMSQNRHRCIPVGRIEEIAIVKHGQFWEIDVTSSKTGKGLEKRMMGMFNTLEDAENAMTRLMRDFDDDRLYIKVANNPRIDDV
jgi:hypothetical protein